MRTRVKKTTKFIRLPFRMLHKARDMYTRTMLSCWGKSGCRGSGLGSYSYIAPIATNSIGFKGMIEEDLRQLVLMSVALGKSEVTGSSTEERRKPGKAEAVRTYSIGVGKMGRIDEEEPCDFVEVIDDVTKQNMFTSSSSSRS